MGSVHTHQRIFTIERCDNPSYVQNANVVEKTKENNQKVKKINWIINKHPPKSQNMIKLSTMGFRYLIKEHVETGMMA